MNRGAKRYSDAQLIALTLVLLAGVGLFIYYSSIKPQQEERAAFLARVAEFDNRIAKFTDFGELAKPMKSNVKIKGPVLVIDLDERKVDDYHKVRPWTLPSNPDAVAYVLLMKCSQRLVGSYTDGAKAFQYQCTASLVDLKSRTMLAEEILHGPKPPTSKGSIGIDNSGGRPIEAIGKFLGTVQDSQ